VEEFPDWALPGQTGHCELDLAALFRRGLDRLTEDVRARRDDARAAGDEEGAASTEAFLEALAGLCAMAERGAAVAAAAMERAGPARQEELAAMAAVCRRVAHKPPATFREALQLTWLVIAGCAWAEEVGLVAPGHLDRTLWPYYRRDLEAGRLTRDGALELLECFYLLVNESVPDGLAVAVMVGGRDARGRDATNDLSYLCLTALRRTGLAYPTVGVCWHPGTPDELTDLAVELISQGYSTPAFFGDETIQRGLELYGVPPAERHRYINSTCVEITPSGASNVWVASPYISLCEHLLEAVAAQAAEGGAESFEDFLAAVHGRIAAAVDEAVREQNEARRTRARCGGKPLQSVFTRDCVRAARDIDRGGARYNWIECSFVGLANFADSLEVIREEIFVQEALDFPALQALLASDYKGAEEVRQRFRNQYPKYGNDERRVDRLVAETVELLRGECGKHRVAPDDSPYVPGAFCWIMHEELGRLCGATPDGRRAGEPFADGCGPAQGREVRGPTAAILSVTSWDAAPLIGGAAYNMKFDRSLFSTPADREPLRDLVVTFLKRGGFETQINVVDREVLRRAREDPEAYRDLVVRIGGYTDYFVRLSPRMQEEVARRTAFNRLG
jgi:formate C-acetyltransferase